MERGEEEDDDLRVAEDIFRVSMILETMLKLREEILVRK